MDTTTLTEAAVFGGEVIAFAIIEKPFTSISTGSAADWNINVTVRSNYAYMPKLWDAFSRSLGVAAEENNRPQMYPAPRKMQYVVEGRRFRVS